MAKKNTSAKPAAKKTTKPVGGAVKKPEDTEEILVTEEYLAAHPDLVAEGVEVGDKIEVPTAPATVGDDETEDAPVVGPKVKDDGSGFSVVRDGEYIRTYKEKALAEQFCSKAGRENCKVILASSIAKVVVEYDVENKETGVRSTATKFFTEDINGPTFKDEALAFNNENHGFVKVVFKKA